MSQEGEQKSAPDVLRARYQNEMAAFLENGKDSSKQKSLKNNIRCRSSIFQNECCLTGPTIYYLKGVFEGSMWGGLKEFVKIV